MLGEYLINVWSQKTNIPSTFSVWQLVRDYLFLWNTTTDTHLFKLVATGILALEAGGLASSRLRQSSTIISVLALIYSFSIDPSTGKPLNSAVTALATRGNGIEASKIIKNGNYFYLFTSWDACCAGWCKCLIRFDISNFFHKLGTSSTYNIRVGRSSKYLCMLFWDTWI
jgi:hypothetical protein